MTTYIVATRRGFRGHSATAKDAVAGVAGIQIKGASNPDIVVVEASPERANKLQKQIGEAYRVELELKHNKLDFPVKLNVS